MTMIQLPLPVFVKETFEIGIWKFPKWKFDSWKFSTAQHSTAQSYAMVL